MSVINRFGLLVWLVIIACFVGGMKVEYFWRDLVPLVGLVLIGTVCLLTSLALDATPQSKQTADPKTHKPK